MARKQTDEILSRALTEKPVEAEVLRESLVEGALPTVSFFFMLGVSAFIAWLGLMAGSTAVIIGAMIVAPLMNPIMTIAFGIAYGEWRLIVGPFLILASGILMVTLISFGLSSVLGTRIVGSEIISRTNPNLLDLGVAIGAGAAGAFARSRASIGNALPGVAIAVALVPPLCVMGYGLSLTSVAVVDPAQSLVDDVTNIEWGAMLLFLVNLTTIILVGSIIFLTQGYGRWKAATPGMLASLCLTAIIAIPLTISFGDFVRRDRVLEAIADMALEDPRWEGAWLQNIVISANQDPILVKLDVTAPKGLITAEKAGAIRKAITEQYQGPVEVQINLFIYEVLQ